MTPTDYFSLVAVAAAFGIAMKISDLLNEHGLRLFYADAPLFGVLWGLLGSLLVTYDTALANAILAMVLAFIVQLRIDYINHAIGTVLVIISFLAASAFAPNVFFLFFASFVLFGGIRAYIGDVRKKKDIWFRLSEPGWVHYYIVPFAWSAMTGVWFVFVVFAIYRSCYNIAKYGLYWAGAYSKL